MWLLASHYYVPSCLKQSKAMYDLYKNRRSLKCDRLRVHKNFMLSLVIRYLVSVVYYEPYIYGQENPQVWYKELGQVCKPELKDVKVII